MSPRSENRNETPRVRDGRRRELRELLISAANAARLTRQSAVGAAMDRSAPRAVRERMSVLLAAAR
jgi:hypothetical protein